MNQQPEHKNDFLLSVVAPVYNEYLNIDVFVSEVQQTLQSLMVPCRYELVLVNDGSTDGSAEKLDALAQQFPEELLVIHLTRNFGHAAAVFAGLEHATGDAVILMDSDMQDDPKAFEVFVEKWLEGYEVIYAVRSSRQESLVHRVAFWSFYRLLQWMVKIKIPADAGNFCLMGRRIVDQIQAIPEKNRYFPGIRAWVGGRQIGVPIARRPRYDKNTRVGFWGLWKLSMDAFFSFTYFPIALFRVFGCVALALSGVAILFALYHKFFTGKAIPSWTSNLVATSFLGGINLLGISILGEYIARIYDEIKHRPIYIVDNVVGKPHQK